MPRGRYQEGSAVEGRKWVFTLRAIARQYAYGWLCFDVLTIAPSAFDIQGFILARGWVPRDHYGFPALNTGASDLFLLRVVRGLRLVKLVRLVRGARLLKRWQTRVALSWSSLRLIQLLVILMLTMHWFACLLALQVRNLPRSPAPQPAQAFSNLCVWLACLLVLQTAFSLDPLTTWLGRYDHCGVSVSEPNIGDTVCTPPFVLWLQCAYWAMGIITGLNVYPPRGLGVHVPIYSLTNPGVEEGLSDSEMVVQLCVMLAGALVWAYVLASFVDIIINMSPERKEFRNSLDSLNRFLHLHNFPADHPQLCIEMREHFQSSMHLHRERANMSLYKLMSPKLQGRIVRQVCPLRVSNSRLDGDCALTRARVFGSSLAWRRSRCTRCGCRSLPQSSTKAAPGSSAPATRSASSPRPTGAIL